jgi:hypothetical protein
MRRAGLVRCVVLGAAGFAIGWAIAAGLLFSGIFAYLAYFIGGAVAGGTLGLAFDWRMTLVLVLAGFAGGGFGFFIPVTWALISGSRGTAVMGPAVGMLVGAMLGMALGSWREPAVLALAGLVGFGVAEAIAAASQPLLLGPSLWEETVEGVEGVLSTLRLPQQGPLQSPPWWRLTLDYAVRGAIGGAALGLAFGYLEARRRPVGV